MNIGERIALLQEELKFEDERQDVLYPEFLRFYDPWPDELEKNLTSEERRELLSLNEARQREESEALVRRPEFLTWNSAEETESNLLALLQNLRMTNDIVGRMIEIISKDKKK